MRSNCDLPSRSEREQPLGEGSVAHLLARKLQAHGRCNARILTHKSTRSERFLQSFSTTWQPPRESKSLIIRICLDCHGRGREFESRRPRHSHAKNSRASRRALAAFFCQHSGVLSVIALLHSYPLPVRYTNTEIPMEVFVANPRFLGFA